MSFGEAIEKANEAADGEQTVYVTGGVNAPYIYVLFYSQYPPQDYIDTVQITELDVQFQHVASFGNYVFNTDALEYGRPGVYIVDNNSGQEWDAETVWQSQKYSVLVIP